jgi:NAD(P)-dependent dehydrogenase (short-subunit alcohol dehydrogenase family)
VIPSSSSTVEVYMAQRRPLNEQVMVITGASSGIGLATARMVAARGAKVVLAARDEAELEGIVGDITARGGAALAVTADVANPDDVERIGERAIGSFGRIDTWFNNAGVSVYGKLLDVPLDDQRRVFETNFWGVVLGSRTAVRLMRAEGGVLINMGSIVSDRAVPLQGIYAASKHAIKAYTDTLRMELEHDRVPVAVTLIKPGAIDTPYYQHAKNYMSEEPAPPPPVYSADTVARAVCACAERPVRDITIGGGGRMIATMGALAPRLTDLVMERTMFRQQKSGRPNDHLDSLHTTSANGEESGGYEGHVMQSSAYTRAMLSDVGRALPFLALGAGVAAAVTAARRH